MFVSGTQHVNLSIVLEGVGREGASSERHFYDEIMLEAAQVFGSGQDFSVAGNINHFKQDREVPICTA